MKAFCASCVMPSQRILLLPLVLVVFCMTISYVSANVAGKDTGKCVFKDYKDTHELKNVERIRKLIGKKYTSHDIEGKYVYTVGICADLNQDAEDAGVVQVEKIAGTPDKIRNVGSLKRSHIMAGTDWVFLEYKGGEARGTSCNKEGRRTAILLGCDENVGDEEARMIFVEEEKEKETDCYYLFEMKHKALCPDMSSSSTLGIGSVLVIVFVSLLAVYVVIGFLYQRFILGSKGLEQIPNYEFWKDFGNLQADGCNLVFRTKGRRSAGGFSGIGDEQLEPADEPRDDNLLPM